MAGENRSWRRSDPALLRPSPECRPANASRIRAADFEGRRVRNGQQRNFHQAVARCLSRASLFGTRTTGADYGFEDGGVFTCSRASSTTLRNAATAGIFGDLRPSLPSNRHSGVESSGYSWFPRYTSNTSFELPAEF